MPLTGYTIPRSPTGRSSLVPYPPWHYVGDFLVVEAKAAREARQFGLVGRLLKQDEDQEGEQAEREGEADQPPDIRNALEGEDEERGANRVERKLLPFGRGRGHRRLSAGRTASGQYRS